MHTRWSLKLEDKVTGRIADALDRISGAGAADYADYREQCGYIRGLRESLQLAQEVDAEILGG